MPSETTSGVSGVALYTSDGAGVATRVSGSNPIPTSGSAPVAANILDGFVSHTATTGATTVITVLAGRTWVGTVSIATTTSVAAASATAGQARGVVATAGTNVTPAAGTVGACEARCGANAATGTVGSQSSNSVQFPLTVIAPAGNSVTVTLASTIAGTAATVDCSCTGALI
jgi:hypothetical protein